MIFVYTLIPQYSWIDCYDTIGKKPSVYQTTHQQSGWHKTQSGDMPLWVVEDQHLNIYTVTNYNTQLSKPKPSIIPIFISRTLPSLQVAKKSCNSPQAANTTTQQKSLNTRTAMHPYTATFKPDLLLTMTPWKFCYDISNGSGVIVWTDKHLDSGQTNRQNHKQTLLTAMPLLLCYTVWVVNTTILLFWSNIILFTFSKATQNWHNIVQQKAHGFISSSSPFSQQSLQQHKVMHSWCIYMMHFTCTSHFGC